MPEKSQETSPMVNVLLDDVDEILQSVDEMSGNESSGEIKAILGLLQEAWSVFKSKYYEAKASKIAITFNMKQIQISYAKTIGKLNDMLKCTEPEKTETVEPCSDYELPKIKLSEFYGKDGIEYRNFIDLFDKIIHTNVKLSQDVKMHYLKTSLKGTAARHVAHLPATAESYDTCRALLEKRYGNKRDQIAKHINAILDLPAGTTEKSDHLLKLHDTVNESILAIKNIDETFIQEMENQNAPMLINVLLRKLSPETIKNYEYQLTDRRKAESLGEFLAYLENRTAAVESAEKQAGSSSVVNIEKSKEIIKCMLCNSNHYIAKCQVFMQKSVTDRINFIKNNNLCLNCLSAHADECKSNFSCRICMESHHSLLHQNEN